MIEPPQKIYIDYRPFFYQNIPKFKKWDFTYIIRKEKNLMKTPNSHKHLLTADQIDPTADRYNTDIYRHCPANL